MKRLFTSILIVLSLISHAQLSFYDQDPVYEGTEQNNLFTKYSLSYDYNNDGISDILHFQKNEIYVLYGDGSQFNTEELVFSHNNNFLNFSNSADLDGDGRLDFVINTNTEILVFSGTESGILLENTLQEDNANIPSIVDFDSDGVNDIIYNDTFEIVFLKGQGNHSFLEGVILTESISELGSVFRYETVDLDADNDLDLLILDLNNSKAHAFYFDNTLSFEQSKSVNASGIDFASGDYDLDGVIDLAIINGSGNIEIYTNETNDFVLTYTYNTFSVQSLTSYDYNSNGRKDLLISNRQTDLTLLTSRGDGTFDDPDYIIEEMPKFSKNNFEDFNNDGQPDIIGSSAVAQNHLILIPLFPDVSSANPYSSISLRPDPSGTDGSQLEDLDMDGNLDLVIFSENGAVYIFYGIESGFSEEFSKIETNVYTRGGFTQDIDGDGLLDIVTYNQSQSNGTLGSDKYINLGDRAFDGAQPFKYMANPKNLVFSDFNKDGVNNVIFSTNSNEVVFLTVNENDYDEYFTGSPLIITTSQFATSFELKDINNDDWLDLILGTFNTNSIEIYLSDQAGRFEAPVSISLDENEYATALTIEDLDGDQVDDIATTTTFSNDFIYKLKIFSRPSVNDEFALQETLDLTGNYGAIEIIAADFDGDADIDLFANEFDNLVSTFIINNGETWETDNSILQSFGQNLSLTRDINSDQLIDLVRTNMSSGSFIITTNNSVSEPLESTTEIISAEQQEDESIVFTLNEASSDGRLVLVKEGTAVDTLPSDGTFYSQNSSLGVGSEIGTGNFVVYSGDGAEFTIQNLEAFTDYHIAIFEYNTNSPNNDVINYLTSDYISYEFALKVDQTLTATGIQDYFVSQETFELIVTASSELDVNVAVVSGPLTLENGVATITGDGEVTIEATQEGSKYYNPVEEVYNLTISKEDQELTATGIQDYFVSQETFELEVVSSSGLEVTVSVISGPLTLENGVATITGDGEVTIEAIQDGNEFYNSVEEIYSFTISKEEQDISYPDLGDKDFEIGTFVIEVSSSSGLPVTLELISGPIELSGTTATILDYGTVIIDAIQEGNEAYLLAQATFEFDIIEVLGLEENELIVYPNPTNDFIEIEDLDLTKMSVIELVDQTGRKYSVNAEGNKIDLRQLKNGIYYLRIAGNNEPLNYRIIKK